MKSPYNKEFEEEECLEFGRGFPILLGLIAIFSLIFALDTH